MMKPNKKRVSIQAMNCHFITQEKTIDSSASDPFDLLPDDILFSIFQKLNDAKSLGKSMCVCKRFHYIAPQVDEIIYDVSQKKPGGPKEYSDREIPKHPLKNLLTRTMMKPFTFISQMIKSKPKNEENELDYYSSFIPNHVLKPFDSIRQLHLRLPCTKQRKNRNSSTFLKWEAVFGREIQSCVMIGAKSLTENCDSKQPPKESEERVRMSEDELKLRIVWTISCLIAASARHYLIQETLRNKETIENIVVSDESDQGRLYLNKEGIREIRDQLMIKENGSSPSSSSNNVGSVMEYRSKVPALKMKMWYLDRIELPESGKVMNGATLVVISPASDEGGAKKMMYDELVMRAFGEDLVLGDVAKKLVVAKRCYSLEMNSF